MKNILIYSTKNRVYLNDGVRSEELFNSKDYRSLFKDDPKNNMKLFENIVNNYKVTNMEDIRKNFLYLFNIILISNTVNYIRDRYEEEEFSAIIFDKSIEKSRTNMIKYNNFMEIDDFLGGIIIALVNSDSYLKKDMRIEYGEVERDKNLEIDFSKNIEYFFYYEKLDIKELKDKLKVDLIAFEFVKKNWFDKFESYSLPIYVDEKSLIEKGLDAYEQFLPNWKSIAYLNMLKKVHEFFTRYYKLEESEEELPYDNLMIALISLLSYEEKPFPKGLKKSIEVGRSTAGKCYIIDTVQRPISLPEPLALTLQAKDVFSTVPKIGLNSI